MTGRSTPAARLARPLLALLGLAFAVGILEGGARIVEKIQRSGEGEAPVRVDDPLLEYRVAPSTGGHDARGYRNRAVLDRPDIVALGDSQTWGVNASVEESWPAQLARETGKSVYNMGHGGYGPLHYSALAEEALSFSPRLVLVALYFGNDVFDAYDLAYRFEAHTGWRHPDAVERKRIASAHYPDLKRMFFQRVNYRRPGFAPLSWLRANTAAGRLAARGSFLTADPLSDRVWAEDHPQEGFVYHRGDLQTVFHTTYRLAAVDTRLERIREGLRITLASLAELKRVIEEEGDTELLVVLLPTKERIFAAAVEAADLASPPSYRESLAFEGEIAARLAAWMDVHEIAYVDALAPLEAGVLRGEALFPPNGDGHFTPEGYRVVAHAVASELEARQSSRR